MFENLLCTHLHLDQPNVAGAASHNTRRYMNCKEAEEDAALRSTMFRPSRS
jgi:hypothetical protein